MTQPQSLASMMLADSPGLVSHPGLVAALQSGRATSFQTRAVGMFLDQLELNKQVTLARQSGAHLNLSPADKQLLDGLGVGYNDVDAARQVQHPPAAESVHPSGPGGFLTALKTGLGMVARGFGGANPSVQNPVAQKVFHGLDRAADIAATPYRGAQAFGLVTPFTPSPEGGPDVFAQNVKAMQASGYDSANFFDQLAFYSHGEQVYGDLQPLRDQFGDEQVTLAARFAQAKNSGDADFFQQLAAGKNPDQVAALQQQLNDPKFQDLVQRVDSLHISPGRDLARSLGIDPVAHANVFKAVSGSADAAVSWYLDPTLILGKAREAYKVSRIGLNGALDGEGVRRILDPANRRTRDVQRGWQMLLDDANVIRTGTPQEAAAALAAINGRTSDLVPLIGDITGRTRVLRRAADGTWITGSGPPITTMDELTEYLVHSNAMLRISKGLAATETPLMPGAVSRFGYRRIKGLAAGAATNKGLQRHGWIDVREDPARLIPTPGDSAGSTVPDDVADALKTSPEGEAGAGGTSMRSNQSVESGPGNQVMAAAARGQAILNERRYGRFVSPNSRAGKSIAYFSPGAIASRFRYAGQRLTNLLPVGQDIVWASPDSTEFVRRFALTFMGKAEANLLDAQYAAGDEAARMAIAKGILTQAVHAAGLPASESGRMIADRILADATETFRRQQVYSPVAGADTYLNPNAGQQVHAALWDGQLDTGIRVPAFAEMQKVAAKVSIWDHTMRKPLSSDAADDIMSILKPAWLTTGSNVSRNVLEDWAGAAIRGQGKELIKARSAIATRRILTGAFDNPIEARKAVGRAAGHLGNAVIIRHMRGLKVSAHLAITDKDYLAALQDIGTPEVNAWMERLAGDAHKAILSPGEADQVDEITRAGYQVRDLRIKLEPGGYDAVPADGGKGARAWSANLASRITGSGIGEHALGLLLDPSLSREEKIGRQADFLESDAATEFRERAQRVAYTKDGIATAGNPTLQRQALEDLAGDQLDDMESLLTSRGAPVRKALTGHRLFRVDRVGADLTPESRPNGTYYSLVEHDDFQSPHAEDVASEGPTVDYHARGTTKDVLELPEEFMDIPSRSAGFGPVSLSAGVLALKHLAPGEFKRLLGMDRDELVKLYNFRFGKHDFAPAIAKGYVDQYAMLEAFGAQIAREKGYKALLTRDATNPNFSEYVALTKDAVSHEADQGPALIEPLAKYLMSYGQAPTAEWIAKNIPDELRPAHAIGRTWVATSGGGTVAGVKDALRSASRAGYQHLIERPIQQLSRNPIYLINFVRAKRNLAGYADRLVEQGIARPQAEAIFRSTAGEQAFHATVKQVDNPELRTQMDVIGRNFFSFSRATQDFLRRWGRTFREDPTRLRKAQLAVEAGVHSGFITKDDQGNYQFTYPGSGAAINALIRAGVALHIPGMAMLPVVPNLSTKMIYLNAGLDNPVAFTVSPLVSTPVAVLEGLFPGHELGKADLDVIMRGQLGAGRPQWQSYMPTVLRRFWDALDGDTRNSQTASAVRNAIMHMDAAGLTPPADATPAQRDEYIQRVRNGARNQLVLRAIFASFAPGAPGQPEEATSGDAADPFYRAQGIASLQDELRLMIGQYGYQKAAAVWLKLHPDKQAYLVSATETAGKSAVVPATRSAEQFMQDNKAFLQKYTTVGGYFIPTDPGEFSQQAWQAQLEMGLRTRKDIGEFYNDVRIRGAEQTYYAALDKRDAAVADALARGDKDQAKAIKVGFSLWSEQFQAYNPLFAEKQSSYDTRVEQAKQALGELRQMLGDPSVPAFPDMPGVQAMVDAYAAHTQFSAQLRGVRSAQATAARDGEASAFNDYMKRLVGQYPGIKDLYNGLFRTLDNDLDYVAGG